MKKETGKFITFEGIEGCGKSTQAKLLCEALKGRGIPHILTKEPGGTAIGKEIRRILLNPDNQDMAPVCEAMLYLADRAQHHKQVVKPALAEGTWVICDRYHDSTLAYQGAARGLKRTDLDRMFSLATGAMQPHLTFLLDLDPELGLGRAQQRNKDQQLCQTEGRFEKEQMQFHQAVRASFLQLADQEPHRFIIIPADGSPERVFSHICGHLKEFWAGSRV